MARNPFDCLIKVELFDCWLMVTHPAGKPADGRKDQFDAPSSPKIPSKL